MSLISNVRWVAVAQVSRVATQLLSITFLSRLLSTESYGLMAMAMAITNFAFLFRDMGTSAAIIQRKEINDALKCTAYWFNVGLAMFIALILIIGAFPFAAAFNEPRLGWIIVALASVFPISSLGLVHQALMERNSKFRVLARIETGSSFAGLAMSLVLALKGMEIWSLVLSMIFSSVLTTVQLLIATDWRPRILFERKELKSLLGFGANLSLFHFVNYFSRNADSMIIGRLLGAASLGVYSIAYKVMLFPLQNLTAVASRALFPTMSRCHGATAEIGILYLRSVGVIAVVTAPMMAGLYFLREPFVTIMFGPRWIEVIDVLKWLAPVGFIQSINSTTGTVFMALGRPRLMLGLGIVGAILQVSAFFLGVRWGIEGVAACYFFANLIYILPTFTSALVLLRVKFRHAALKIGMPMAASGAMLCFLWAFERFLRDYQAQILGDFYLSTTMLFSLNVTIGIVTYGFSLMVMLRQDTSDIRALLRLG
jgi:O-antigen/teichoic acid export membrane protein